MLRLYLFVNDNLSASYRDVCKLTRESFRSFVRNQVYNAHAQLEDLLHLYPKEKRENADIRLWIHRVVQNAAENNKNWNFLTHTHDTQGTLLV